MKLITPLYDHQKQAVEKLSRIKIGALYMEMGTGKTRTALELIAKRFNAGKVDHILWLCPCSVKKTIEKEIRKHIHGDDISMFTICGIETLSSSIRTNRELLQLVRQKKTYLIVDESILVKNSRAKRTQSIMRLADYCEYKLILNGTPISRNEADLFAQWYILDWRILGYRSFWSFSRNHVIWDDKIRGRIKEVINVDYLVRKIAPYTFQVKKEECLNLPDKTYTTYYYELDDTQAAHYGEIALELLVQVDEFRPSTIYRLFTALQNVISGFVVYPIKRTKKLLFKNPLDNPRIQMLLEIVSTIDDKDKVIIYCNYQQEIQDITKVLNNVYGAGSAVTFYGKDNLKKRQENIQQFENHARFLIANRSCAGYGLNLQFCKYIIFYSHSWDLATRSQAEDRIHRIGQAYPVQIIDICAERTLDERILDCLYRKQNLVELFKDHIAQRKFSLAQWLGVENK